MMQDVLFKYAEVSSAVQKVCKDGTKCHRFPNTLIGVRLCGYRQKPVKSFLVWVITYS